MHDAAPVLFYIYCVFWGGGVSMHVVVVQAGSVRSLPLVMPTHPYMHMHMHNRQNDPTQHNQPSTRTRTPSRRASKSWPGACEGKRTASRPSLPPKITHVWFTSVGCVLY